MTARSLAEQALELAGKASKPPWVAASRLSPAQLARGPGTPVLRFPPPFSDIDYDDAEFIAFARSALPALAERVIALEEVVQWVAATSLEPHVAASAETALAAEEPA